VGILKVIVSFMIITKVALSPVYAQRPPVVREVRAAVAAKDFGAAQKLLADARNGAPVTPGWLEAQSWLGRGYLAAKQLNEAERSAAETRKLSLELLRGRKLDAEPSLPTALGASIEVQAQVLNARGQKAEAVAFLEEELKRWQGTSLRARLQKNLHLISLAGKPAPALETKEFAGAQPPRLASLKGRKTLLFFWAHWCGDCKAQSGVIARVAREFPGVAVIGPTQTYGYVAGGADAPRSDEIRYIDQIRQKYYSGIAGMTVPVSEENFEAWGASTTPTIAVIDAQGIVTLYHPGKISYEELLPYVRD